MNRLRIPLHRLELVQVLIKPVNKKTTSQLKSKITSSTRNQKEKKKSKSKFDTSKPPKNEDRILALWSPKGQRRSVGRSSAIQLASSNPKIPINFALVSFYPRGELSAWLPVTRPPRTHVLHKFLLMLAVYISTKSDFESTPSKTSSKLRFPRTEAGDY